MPSGRFQLYLEIESKGSEDWNSIRSIVETLNGIDIQVYHFLMCYIVLIVASLLDNASNQVVGCINQKRYTAIVLIFQPKEDNSGNKLTEMAEDEANADDPEDDINAYITWFPRYVVCSDMAGLVGSG